MSKRPTKEIESNGDGAVPTSWGGCGNLALFYFDEVIPGDCLGQGSFADVYEVHEFKPLAENDRNLGKDRLDARRYYSEQVKGDYSTGTCKKYAIKCLRNNFDDPKMFRFAAKDIETEVNLLAKLDHPHIIKIYAKSASGTKASKCTKERAHDFFIVEDRLSSTLSDKIFHWKRGKQRIVLEPRFFRFNQSLVTNTKKLLVERLRVAYDVASAIEYLHEERIIYRDLKADNVGFDVEGKCKLFDFGLARRLPSEPENKLMNDTYIMSGKTGSLLFMAPEVWHKQPYNEKADVYSWAMLLWNILSLELPYLEFIYDPDVFTEQVMVKGQRPTIHRNWPKKIKDLLCKAWSKDMNERPTMQLICIILKEVIASTHLSTAESTPPIRRSTHL